MASVLLDGDLLIVRIAMFHTDQAGLNIRHYRVSNSQGAGVTDQEVVDALDLLYEFDYKASLSSAATYRGVSVQKFLPAPPLQAVFSTVSAGIGGLVGDPLPKQVAGLVTLRTQFAGRKFRGRMYIPFPSESVNEVDTQPSAAYIASIAAIGTNMIAQQSIGLAPDTADVTPVLFHRLGGTTDDLTSRVASPLWATQRRRGDFGRKNILPF